MENKELNEELLEEYETVTLELDDGTEEEFAIIDSFIMGDKKYVLLALIKGDVISDDTDDMVFMIDDTDDTCEEGEISLSIIESDEEYETVVDFYVEEEE